MSINRGVDNENVKHVHSGILLNSNIEYHLQQHRGPNEVRQRKINFIWHHLCVEYNKNYTNRLFTEQKWTHRPQSQTCVTRGQTWGKVIDREFGIYINMLLCIKYITKSDLLYYTWTSTQYSVVVYVGNEPEEEYTHTHTHTHTYSFTLL